MRRWLSILLLVVMPLQLNWAAVAAYCAHESAPKATHFGHHEHDHDQHVSAAASPDASSPGVGIDISDCHFHCPGVAALPMVIVMPAVVAVGPRSAWRAGAVSAPVLAPPDRPQWPRLA